MADNEVEGEISENESDISLHGFWDGLARTNPTKYVE